MVSEENQEPVTIRITEEHARAFIKRARARLTTNLQKVAAKEEKLHARRIELERSLQFLNSFEARRFHKQVTVKTKAGTELRVVHSKPPCPG